MSQIAALPWVASARTARSGGTKSGPGSPTDHATMDGKVSLCGLREVGYEPTATFIPGNPYTCRRCTKKARELAK